MPWFKTNQGKIYHIMETTSIRLTLKLRGIWLATHPQPIQLVPNSFINFASQISLSRLAAGFVSWTQIPIMKDHRMNTVNCMTCYDVCKMLWSMIMTLWTPVIFHNSYEHQSSMISTIPRDLMYDQWSWMIFNWSCLVSGDCCYETLLIIAMITNDHASYHA